MPENLKAIFESAWAAKFLGALAGVWLSMAMIPPENNRAAFYRFSLGTVAGVIFAPTLQRIIPFFSGDNWEQVLAAATATGFIVWFALESIARWIKKPDTGNRLIAWIERSMGVKDKADKS